MFHVLRSAESCVGSASIKTLLWMVGAAVLATGAPAYAQQTDGEAARARIENVTVTARKREELSQSVPLAMTALTGEIQKPTVRDLTDLNGFSANVRIDADRSRANGISIQIRGISPVRTDDNSFDAPIAVVIDGIHMGSLAGQLLENFDIERVEILRGPQGTLFGKNTVGGAINVIRSRPTGEFGGKLKYTFGKWGQQEVRAIFNVPVIEDKLAVKGFFTHLHSNGFIRNTTLDRNVPKTDYQNFGMTFLFTPNDKFEALLTVERFHDDGEGGGTITNWNLAPGVAPPPTDPREPNNAAGFLACLFGAVPCRTDLDVAKTVSGDQPNPARLRTTAITLNMKYEVNDNISLVSVTGYRDMSEKRLLDFDATSANFITLDRDNAYDQFSQELRFEGSWENFSVVVGGYYWRSEFDQQWITGGQFWDFVSNLSGYSLAHNIWLNPAVGDAAAALLGVPGITPVATCISPNPARDLIFGAVQCDVGAGDRPYGPNHPNKLYEHQVTESIAFFAQADWEFIENWTLTAGLRWTQETKDFEAAQAYILPLDRVDRNNFLEGFQEFADLDNKWTEISPKVGISWQATEDVMVYGSYSEGFHSGGFFGVNQNVADFIRDQYDPEFANTWEVGVKSQMLDNTLQVNLTLFRNNFKDKQESSVQFDDSTQTVATVFSNVGSARYQGIELEVQWVVNENLNFFGSLGILDAKYTEFETDINPNDDAIVGATIEDATFLTPRNAPKTTWGVGANYNIPVGNDGEIDMYVKYNRVSSIEASLINLSFSRVKPQDDLTASLGYSWDKFRVTVYGKNLTNEVNEVPFPIAPLFAAGTIGPGRSWGVELQADF